MATSKAKLVELLETLPAGRLERLVRVSDVKLYGDARLPLVERAARPMNVAYVAADLKPELLPIWAGILGIDPAGLSIDVLRDTVIDYVRRGPPGGAGGAADVLEALRAGNPAKKVATLIEARYRQFTGNSGLTSGELRLRRLLGLAAEATKFGAGAGQFLAFISRDWPNPVTADLTDIGAHRTLNFIQQWHANVLGSVGQQLRGEQLFLAACAASNEPDFDPSSKHRKLWKAGWAETRENVPNLAIAYALQHPGDFGAG